MRTQTLATYAGVLTPDELFLGLSLLCGSSIMGPQARLAVGMCGAIVQKHGTAPHFMLDFDVSELQHFMSMPLDDDVFLHMYPAFRLLTSAMWCATRETGQQLVEAGRKLRAGCGPDEAVQPAIPQRCGPRAGATHAEDVMERSLIMMSVGGGPFIAGRYDNIWRCALLYSMAAQFSLEGLEEDRNRFLQATSKAMASKEKPPILAVLAWVAPLMGCDIYEEFLEELPPNLPIKSWLLGADWSCLDDPKLHPNQLLMLQAMFLVCPPFFTLFIEVLHELPASMRPRNALDVLPAGLLDFLRRCAESGHVDSLPVTEANRQAVVTDPEEPSRPTFTRVLYEWSAMQAVAGGVEGLGTLYATFTPLASIAHPHSAAVCVACLLIAALADKRLAGRAPVRAEKLQKVMADLRAKGAVAQARSA